MNESVVVVAGLPGCGKTTYLCQLCRDGWLVLDDFKANAHDNCSQFRESRKYPALLVGLRENLRCVVADIDFCKTESRAEADRVLRAEVPGVEIGWRFFANDILACDANIRRRNRDSLEADLRKLSEYSTLYSIPKEAVVLPVTTGSV